MFFFCCFFSNIIFYLFYVPQKFIATNPSTVFICCCCSLFVFLISHVTFVMSLFVPHLSCLWCLGRGVLHACGISGYLITKTYLYNFDPLKPHFYIVKLGFTGYTLFFLFLLRNIDCGYSLEPPPRGGSNEYPQSMFWAEIWKLSDFFIWKFSFSGGEIFYIFK